MKYRAESPQILAPFYFFTQYEEVDSDILERGLSGRLFLPDIDTYCVTSHAVGKGYNILILTKYPRVPDSPNGPDPNDCISLVTLSLPLLLI